MIPEAISGAVDGNDLFVSDVHLDEATAARQRVLERFLEVHARRGRRLFILGDLFNAWYGRKQLDVDYVRRLTDALASTAAAGVEVHFLAGNRDFYCLEELGRAASMTAHSHGLTIESFGQRVYLSHGHRLYSADHRSRGAHSITHSPLVEAIFQRLPAGLARFLAQGYQRHSKRVVHHKSKRMLSMNDEALLSILMQGHDAMVCGHAHRISHTIYRRINRSWDVLGLGCWDEHPHFLRRGPDGWHFHLLQQSAAAVDFDFVRPALGAGEL